MFKLIVSTNDKGETIRHVEHTASGGRYLLPSFAKQIAIDCDGDIWAYESGEARIGDALVAWVDGSEDGNIQNMGKIPSDYLSEYGQYAHWRDSLAEVVDLERVRVSADAAPAPAVKDIKPALDGRQLLGKVTEILDQAIRNGLPGASSARAALRDLGSHGFEFSSYRTINLVQAFVEMGYDLRTVRHFNPLQAIDDAVHQARGE